MKGNQSKFSHQQGDPKRSWLNLFTNIIQTDFTTNRFEIIDAQTDQNANKPLNTSETTNIWP